jgi:NADPH:quinone reductase-like Zn-dependent oxidoreductase
MIFVLCGAGGFRVGEALGIEMDKHISPDFLTIRTGLLLTQMAKLRGARVLTTVSHEEKAELSRQTGADELILYTRSDFAAEVKRLTEGRGPAVVYDSVGKSTFEQSLTRLQARGTPCTVWLGRR